MIGNIAHRDWQCGVVALNDIAERVANQHGFDAGTVKQTREAGVVAGEHDDFFACLVEFGEIGLSQAAGDGLCRHGFRFETRNRWRLGYTEPPINSQA